jgi:hypothetical protein
VVRRVVGVVYRRRRVAFELYVGRLDACTKLNRVMVRREDDTLVHYGLKVVEVAIETGYEISSQLRAQRSNAGG